MEYGYQALPEEQIRSAKRILTAIKSIYPDENVNEVANEQPGVFLFFNLMQLVVAFLMCTNNTEKT